MIPNITSIAREDLISRVKPLSATRRSYERALRENEPASPLSPDALSELEQIEAELGRRQAIADKNYKNLQWDAYHFAEDVLGTANQFDGDQTGRLIAGLIKFRKEFNIQSCNVCRTE